VLDPATGRIVIANAGHNLPFVRSGGTVTEIRATGMPLGLLPGIRYEEVEGTIAPDSNVLLYSDGLVEAHDSDREMFGFDRLRDALVVDDAGSELLDRLLETLRTFTGPDHEQEDDITLVTLRRSAGVADSSADSTALTSFSLPGLAGNDREAMDRVAAAVADLELPPDRVDRLKTAVSEAAMNAIEYGSHGRADVPFDVDVVVTPTDVIVRVTDRALSGPVPTDPETPVLERKLAGDQKPRGWGLFLIEHMVDAIDVSADEAAGTQTVTLRIARQEKRYD
jgi:anti-sigma regulatory factor (Ser/Thr protein kinase)